MARGLIQRQGSQKYYWRGSFNPKEIQRDNGTGAALQTSLPLPAGGYVGFQMIDSSAELGGIGWSRWLTMRFRVKFISLEVVKSDAFIPWVFCLNLIQVSDEHKFFLLGDV